MGDVRVTEPGIHVADGPAATVTPSPSVPQPNTTIERRIQLSHIVTINVQIRDPVALAAACTRLGLLQPVQGKAQLFSAEAEGLIVKLPGWTYPAVIDTAKGTIAFDNYHGAWGEQRELDRLLQAYAVEKSRIEARRAGHSVSETLLADGSIKLTIQVGAGGVP